MNHIEPKQVRALAYKMLLLSECIHLDDLDASQEALEAVHGTAGGDRGAAGQARCRPLAQGGADPDAPRRPRARGE